MTDFIGKMDEIGQMSDGINVSIPKAEEHSDSTMGPIGTPLLERPKTGENYGGLLDAPPRQRPSIPAGLTEADSRSLLKEKRQAADAAAQALATAKNAYRQEVDALDAHKGFMPDVEFAAKLDAIKQERLPDLGKLERKAKNAASELQDIARQIAERASAAPPTLADDDEARAAEMLPLVRAQVESLPLDALAGQLQSAIRSDDLPMAYCLALLLPERLKRPATDVTADGTVTRDGSDDTRNEIRRMISAIKTKLADTNARKLAVDARNVSIHASNLTWQAGERQRASRSYSFQSEGDIRIDPKTKMPLDAVPIGPRRR